ncbi:hypothetical protein [Bifidobacterium moukalabense]|uniref:hypothetical protein n=1 Tax=Bifidobacterium moukalabense TaxID=1333651 RepID=UPI0010F4C752|nr:hypothetical protein [Bifidobacterium moukalabense]
MEGFNADWMPTAYDTPSGTDDGGRHDRHGRRPGGSPMVRIIAIGATVCAVAGVGGIILVDRMDMTRDRNVAACEQAVSARDRQAGLFDRDSERYGTNIDVRTLRKADENLARRWVKARNRPSVSAISCDADCDNATLKRAKEKADGEATRMRKARRTLKSLYGKASDVLGRKADKDKRERFHTALKQAERVLDDTRDADLNLPYLRTRLGQEYDKAKELDAESADPDELDRMASILESLSEQTVDSVRAGQGSEEDDG